MRPIYDFTADLLEEPEPIPFSPKEGVRQLKRAAYKLNRLLFSKRRHLRDDLRLCSG